MTSDYNGIGYPLFLPPYRYLNGIIGQTLTIDIFAFFWKPAGNIKAPLYFIPNFTAPHIRVFMSPQETSQESPSFTPLLIWFSGSGWPQTATEWQWSIGLEQKMEKNRVLYIPDKLFCQEIFLKNRIHPMIAGVSAVSLNWRWTYLDPLEPTKLAYRHSRLNDIWLTWTHLNQLNLIAWT